MRPDEEIVIEPLLSIEQIAEFLQVSTRSVRPWIKQGSCPPYVLAGNGE